MKRLYFFIFFGVSGIIMPLAGDDVTWIAQNPNNNMEDPSNWSDGAVPDNSDTALFDSSIPHISLTPREQIAPFSVLNFHFLHKASVFTFLFNNQSLTFSGLGITGTQTDTNINIINLNNSTYISDQILFGGLNSTSGSAVISVINTGNQISTGILGSQFHSIGNLSIQNNADLSAINEGLDTNTGLGSDVIASISYQFWFENAVNLGNDVSISAINSGVYTGSNSTTRNVIGVVSNHQFHSTGAFQAEDNLSLVILNSGVNDSSGNGNNLVGTLTTGSQVQFDGTCTLGDGSTILVSNSGSNSGSGDSGNFVGYVVDQQFHVSDEFRAGDDLNLITLNLGSDDSTGIGGHVIANIDSNSGSYGNQMQFDGLCTVQDDALIAAVNSGIYSGTNTGIGCRVANLNHGQILFSEEFNASDFLYLTAFNTGIDSAIGQGNDAVGTISSRQIEFSSSCNLGDHAVILAASSGNYSGENSSVYNAVGSVAVGQLYCDGNFQAGNYFNLILDNRGLDSSQGIGNNFIGAIIAGSQAGFNALATLGSHASISIINKGISSNDALSGSYIAALLNGNQFHVIDDFTAGDDLIVVVQNIGEDESTGAGNQSRTGYVAGSALQFNSCCYLGNNASITAINDGSYTGTNTVLGNIVGSAESQLFAGCKFNAGDNFSLVAHNSGLDSCQGMGSDFVGTLINQVQIFDDCTLGDNANIEVTNQGTYSGSNASNANQVGTIADLQVNFSRVLTTGDNFHLKIGNLGDCNTIGDNNDVGFLGNSQLQLIDGCNLGNNAKISILNSGVNAGTGINNDVGYINGSQVVIGLDFVAGSDTQISVLNSALNAGDGNNNVGYVNGSQIVFQNAFKIGDGSLLSAFNSGTVVNSQIVLNQGFDILTGKATLQALNTGNVGEHGISILGNSLGGNANIILGNASLNINTTLPTFTIGELNGDSTSLVQSSPTLIINTDADTHGNFSGTIQNYPSITSAVIKTGTGTQKLSGQNSYTGLTTIEDGKLIVTGSLAGDVAIDPLGTLKGTGSVGNVVNAGTIAPGESIGTLTFLGNFTNNNGNYNVEVNSLGASDLISVTGLTSLNGGTVIVSSDDGYQFQTPYTIITSANITGTYANVIAVSPMLAPILAYDPNHVYLTLQTAILNAAKTSNQKAVAAQLDGILNPNANQTLLLNEMVNLSISAAQESLTSLSGYQHTDDLWATQILNRQFIRRLYDPLRTLVTREPACECACDCNPCEWTGWMEGEGGFTTLKGNENCPGFKMTSYEYTGGIQKTFCNNVTAGIAGSYEYDHIHYSHGGFGKSNTWLAGFYGLYRPDCYYGLIDFSCGHSSNSIHRNIEVGVLKYEARSKPKISQFNLYGELGIDYWVSDFLIQPFAGIETGKFLRHHTKEREDHGWGLTIQKKDWCVTNSRLGVHLTSGLYDFTFSLDLAWNRLLSSPSNKITGRFIEFGNKFDITGVNLDRNSVDYALTISKDLFNNFSGYVECTGESWKQANNYNILAGIEFSW